MGTIKINSTNNNSNCGNKISNSNNNSNIRANSNDIRKNNNNNNDEPWYFDEESNEVFLTMRFAGNGIIDHGTFFWQI